MSAEARTDAGEAPVGGIRGAVDRVRQGWPDVVKGVCILLVVMWQVVAKHSSELPWNDAGGVPQAWTLVSAQRLPLRMPLFFVVSGMFAVGVCGRHPDRVCASAR